MTKLILLATTVLFLSACGTRGSLKSESSGRMTNAEKLLESQNQRN